MSKQVWLDDLSSDKLRLKRPIAVEYRRGHKGCELWCSAFDEYGWGQSYEEAMSDLRSSIVDFYFSLRKRRDSLGKSSIEIWQRMQESLEEVG